MASYGFLDYEHDVCSDITYNYKNQSTSAIYE